MGKIHFKDLKVWQKAIELVKETYSLINFLPKEEIFALSSQMRRAVISIPSNIAEGNSRGTRKEYINFLSIARGSVSELWTQIIVCNELNYIDGKETEKAISLCEEINKMINVMIIKLKEE